MSTPKKKPDLKNALAASIAAEESSVSSRFDKAEAFMNDRVQKRPEPPKAKPSKEPTLAAAKTEKPSPKKEKVASQVINKAEPTIRDSFTMPESDHKRIDAIKANCLKAGFSANKSEIMRAGLLALQHLPAKELREVFDSLKKVKPGRRQSS